MALELGAAKYDEDWQASGNVKNQMLRMDPTFQERALGFSSFTDFVKPIEPRVEIDETRRRYPPTAPTRRRSTRSRGRCGRFRGGCSRGRGPRTPGGCSPWWR
ncbi:hypothetical protein QBC39DRAFT_360349 [Podospora conica]|nr:hypothetical protein QBC39DRAFT_360349 [Schizothecium conicum]